MKATKKTIKLQILLVSLSLSIIMKTLNKLSIAQGVK